MTLLAHSSYDSLNMIKLRATAGHPLLKQPILDAGASKARDSKTSTPPRTYWRVFALAITSQVCEWNFCMQ